MFFFASEKTCEGNPFNNFNKERINFLSEGVPMNFRQFLVVFVPDEIRALQLLKQGQEPFRRGGGS